MRTAEEFRRQYGPWALIAGGSRGLGAAFSEELARRGLNLVVTARSLEPLERDAERLRTTHGIQVRPLAVDFSSAAMISDLVRRIADLEIGLLVCNAADTATGSFFDAEPAFHDRMFDTNCRAPLRLIESLGGRMVGRGRGGILLMSSMAGFQGSPGVSLYAATKAFLLVLGEGLRVELMPRGVDVLVCCPAVVRTPGFLASLPPGAAVPGMAMDPEAVAGEAVRALGRRSILVPGFQGRMARFMMSRLMPRKTAIAMMARGTRTVT